MATRDIGTVAVVVLTYKRETELLELLPMLDQQISASGLDAHVLVVDNDPDASARQTVERIGLNMVRYVHEPTPGISAGRNRALDETTGAHLLIFIDDDERPFPTWLVSLVDTYRANDCAAVIGPVVPEYDAEPDSWISAGGFFVRRMFPTGTELPAAGTGNLLLDLKEVERAGHLRFDARFGLTGGSDTLFTRQLVHAGGRIIWCEEAGVVDKVPVDRMTRQWVTRRAYRSGNSWSRTGLEFEPTRLGLLHRRLDLTARGLIRIGGGAARIALGRLIGSERHDARGTRTFARGRGMVAGAWGRVYHEYRREATR